mmetsp:Transcript_10067/g.19367  ORF Transcript_10067/g.19367 Transcript_10067/m.19367 type:complete len:280 (+) Transcript_10067:347-1186(+)
MQHRTCIASVRQGFVHHIRVSFGFDKHNTLGNCQERVNVRQKGQLSSVVFSRIDPELFNHVNDQKLGAVFNQDFIRIDDHFTREIYHLFGECCAEQKTLAFLWHVLFDQDRICSVAIFFHHVIGFVEHEYFDSFRINRLAFEPVDDFSRCPNHQVCIHFLSPLDRHPGNGQLNFETLHILPHGFHCLVDNLNRQFTRGRHTQSLTSRWIVDFDAIQHAQREGGRFARPRLRLSDQIARRVGENTRECFFLNRRGAIKSHAENPIQKRLGQIEFLKSLGT